MGRLARGYAPKKIFHYVNCEKTASLESMPLSEEVENQRIANIDRTSTTPPLEDRDILDHGFDDDQDQLYPVNPDQLHPVNPVNPNQFQTVNSNQLHLVNFIQLHPANLDQLHPSN